MYLPTAFHDTDIERLQQQMAATRLAIIVTHGDQGLLASHVPLLLDREGEFGTLRGHLARANPQWRDLANGSQAMVIFAGADAYVSPGFYPSKAEHGKAVPTWNFLAVHAYGHADVFSDPERLHALVSSLTDHHEARQAQPWTVEDAPADYLESMLKAIVGFALPIQRLEGKRKLSQNRSAEDIAGVQRGLASSSDPLDNAVAQLMTQ
ncbi:FMN-binding negative transcriptional regulator [Pseudomonas eucalypticola]|uniref:FMN-binding negative transcriptional regulator n=1 Tax=Pseudomonas eucalypticola TaxID=2599595 RepID=A0A7D5H3L2_9PSED|nr:FMN-binding negative transcriptional regulator [Pseudomonas eucalypticola]QKZ07507.1 FMN-binding negative transcriptional regulator [Pseudomonas eucalypticola]